MNGDARHSQSSSHSRDRTEQLSYGVGACRPPCVQFLNQAAWLLVWMSLANVFQSMLVNGLVGTVVTTLEKRFDLHSSESSVIVSGYDISTIPMLILVSYFGSRSHRARWTAAGLYILVLGSALFVLPHFLTEPYDPKLIPLDDPGVCLHPDYADLMTSPNRTCKYDVIDEPQRRFLPLFIVGRLLHGLGAVPLYTICVTFMDDCVSKETFSLYIAIFYASGILGPALGYMVGGYMLSIFVDWNLSIDSEISCDDPLYIGAWWPGFLIGGFVLFLVAVPMTGYPRDLPGAAEVRATKESEANEYGSPPPDGLSNT